MIYWLLFNAECLMREQMGWFPPGEPDIRMPYCWDWAERNAQKSHICRPWASSYMVTTYYPRVLELESIREKDRIPF